MKRLMTWTFVHAAHWALLWGAFGLGIDGAMYTLKFWVWVSVPIAFLLLSSDTAIEKDAKHPSSPLRRVLSWVQAWVTLALLVWFGHIFSALAWAVVMLLSAAFRQLVSEERAQKQAEA